MNILTPSKLVVYLFTTALICIISSPAESKEPLAAYLPPNVLFSIEVENFEELKKNLSKTSWNELSTFPIWGKLSSWMEKEIEKELKENESKEIYRQWNDAVLEPLMESLSGGMAYSIGEIERLAHVEMLNPEGGKRKRYRSLPVSNLILDTKLSKKEFNRMIDSVVDLSESIGKDRIKREIQKIKKQKIHWFYDPVTQDMENLTPYETGLCVFLHESKIFVLSGSKTQVEEVYNRVSNSGEKSGLNHNKKYQQTFDELGESQARIFLNFEEGIQSLQKFRKKNEKIQIPQNPFGVTTDGLINGLGLNGLGQLGLGLDARKGNFLIHSVFLMKSREGFLSLLTPVKGEVEFHEFVPPNALSVSNARFDFYDFWPKMEKMFSGISPTLHLLVSSQIQAFEDQIKVPVRKDLFGSLGSQWVTLTFLNKDLSNQIDLDFPTSTSYAIELKDPLLFDQTLRSVLDSIGGGSELFKDRDYRGVTIRSLRGMEQLGLNINFAVYEDWLLLNMGKEDLLVQLINRMNGDSIHLWEKKSVKYALNEIPSGVRQIDYVDFSEMFSIFEIMFNQIEKQEMGFEFQNGDFGQFPYFMLGWSKDIDDGFKGTVKLFPHE